MTFELMSPLSTKEYKRQLYKIRVTKGEYQNNFPMIQIYKNSLNQKHLSVLLN